ncbi:MAG: hypothetical protein WKF76_10405 [Nocardioidaceae bacterium]
MVAFYRRPDIAWIPITDIDPLHVAFAYRTGNDAPLVASFADLVTELRLETATRATALGTSRKTKDHRSTSLISRPPRTGFALDLALRYL